ncbi:MAG: LptF/LptG family permease [Bryobacteraceae bacterium]|nr:LptF/LptG family permease [Bryobacteraceae bacterium]
MGLLSRAILREISSSALLGAALFVFVLLLQRAAQLFSILVSTSATAGTVGSIFLLLLPSTMPLTLPLGVLVGILITLSRMSGDGEITAMRAAGIPAWRLLVPVVLIALLAAAATGFCSLYLTPWSNARLIQTINQLGAAQLSSEIQPRVFEEGFPNKVLYIGDLIPGDPVVWRNVFIADLTPGAERKAMGPQRGDWPVVTIASEAVVLPDPARNRLQLSLRNGATYEPAADPAEYHRITFPRGEQVLEAKPRTELKAKFYTATPTLELLPELSRSVEARIEFHQRFALPMACLLLGLAAFPLGVSSRRGGRSGAFVITVGFALFYYTALVSLIGLAREGRIPAELAAWLPDAVFATVGILLLAGLEKPGERDWLGPLRLRVEEAFRRLGALPRPKWPAAGLRPVQTGSSRLFFLPQILDYYIISSFFFYFFVLLSTFVLLTEVFNFFELLGDVFRNQIPIAELFEYLFFLAPKLIFDAAPVSVLVATLVSFGILAKNNEITAFKACGVSLHRLSLPVLAASLLLSGALFVFDYSVVTGANVIQERLRNKIKGRPVQTYLRPQSPWIFGQGPRIFYYRYLNENEGVLGGISVYELEPSGFRLRRHIYAERARWEAPLGTWVFQNGWAREMDPAGDRFQMFQGGTATFAGITEPPSWFIKEVKTYKQMTFEQLDAYIAELRQSGFNTVPLQVQYHRKFSAPLFALVMALLSVPFAFLTGTRGALTGVGVSLGIAVAYFALNYLFEQLGNVGQLPPEVAAWSPNALFALAGLYLMSRMRT